MSVTLQDAVILNVDDDDAGRHAVTRTLQRAGCTVLEAAAGPEALEIASREPVDLIVLDVDLPGISGFEVVQHLKADPATAGIPVLHLSGSAADSESVARGPESGADGYLREPVDPEVLLATVKALLRAREAEEALRESRESLAGELAIMQALHEAGAEMAQEGELPALLERTLQAALIISRAEMGNVQLHDPASGALHIVAHRGFEQPFLDFFATVDAGPAACAEALRQRQRVIVEDVAHSSLFAGTPAREVLLEAGVSAVQSTPLIGPTGQLLGVLSTHWRRPHQPEDRVLRALDVLAPLAAGLIERKQAEQERERLLDEVEQQRAFLAAFLDNAPVAMAYLDTDLRFVRANATYEAWAGRPTQELLGRTHAEVVHLPERAEAMREALETREPVRREEVPFTHPGRPGYRGCVDYTVFPVKDEAGKVVGLVLSVEEVTERVQQREQLLAAERARAQLAESLNSEIAHRTKNNLAMAAGLLQLQILQQRDPQVGAALSEAVTRLMTFASVQQEMETGVEGWVDLLPILRRVGAASSGAFAVGNVVVSITGESVALPSKAATNLAVVANELITNAIKHGAPGSDRKLRVDVEIRPEDDSLRLCVWNSGNPVPEEFNPARRRGMGLQLVRDLANQYAGTFALRPEAGGTLAEVIVSLAGLLER